MRRCPNCRWINHDQDHHCRRCGYFLRRHRPLPIEIEPHLTVVQQIWRFIRWFPWGGFIVSVTILGVIGWASYWGYRWTQPMLDPPPNPEFEPALPIVTVTIPPDILPPASSSPNPPSP